MDIEIGEAINIRERKEIFYRFHLTASLFKDLASAAGFKRFAGIDEATRQIERATRRFQSSAQHE